MTDPKLLVKIIYKNVSSISNEIEKTLKKTYSYFQNYFHTIKINKKIK